MISEENIIGEISRSTKIYRVIPRNRFLDLFTEHKAALVWPTLWSDPFENFILLSPVRTSSGVLGEIEFKEDLYGQCWTLQNSSDAMWQIYSPSGDAVRIRTTVGKLIDSLSAANADVALDSCFIGRVTYLSDAKIKGFAQTVFKNGLNTKSVINSLLVKRDAFKHDDEVRLIYFEQSQKKHENGVYKYALNPHDVFDEVMIDPRMSDRNYRKFKAEIIKETGLDEAKIEHSLLYQPPDNITINIP